MISRILKKSRRVLASLLIIVIALIAFLKLTATKSQAAWFDDTYTYRVRASFVHNADIAAERAVTYTLDNAELITASILQSDCDDIRFTDANGKLLKHDLTSTCNNASATYEVIFASIANGTNVFYAYYGNVAAPNVEVDSTVYTALTPSGGDPTAQSTPTSNDEQGPGPISYWNFDEAQGSTANDYSTGSNNDLTITNAVWKTTDLCIIGNCLYFDGSTDYATKSYSADTELLPGTGSFTVSAWFRHDSTAASDTMISRVDAVNGIGWKVYMNSSGFVCFGIDAVAGTFPNDDACTASSFADSQWHYVTAVKNSTTNIQIYIDAKIHDTQTGITSTTLDGTSAAFRVGNDFDDGTNGWSGFIDEVKYYNFAKTASQIVTEFNLRGSVKGVAAQFGPDTNKVLSTGLVGYWKMDESSGNAADSSGNANTLTNNGTTTFTTGKFGNSSSHNGTTQYFSTVTTISGVQTVAFWVNPASTSDDYINLIASTTYINSSSGTISATGFTNPSIYVNGVLNGTITASTWNHVTVTTDTAISASAFEAGRANSAYLNNTGKMDEVRLYNRALSPAEVSALYSWAPGPVGWWKLDENAGTSANDSGDNDYNGTLTGSQRWVSGKVGAAFEFDSSSNRFDLGTSMGNIIGDGSASFTISGWFYPKTYSGSFWGDSKIFSANALTNNSGCSGVSYGVVALQERSSSDVRLYFSLPYQNSGSTCSQATSLEISSVSTNNWYFFAATFDSSSKLMSGYLNGAFAASATWGASGTITWSTNAFISRSSTNYFQGIIDDLKVYNYARTPKQIIEDMNAGHPAGGSPIGSQTVYWKFDEGQGTTANNSGIASSSNGTLTSIASPATSTSGWTFTGKVNKGIIFDGTDDKVVIATANDAAVDFATTEQFSGSAWVYVTTMPGSGEQDAIIAKWDETGNLAAYKLYVENDDADTTGNFEVQIYDESASQAITASQSIDQVAVNTWYHVAFTFNGGTAGAAGDLKLYVDGRFTAQNSANASFLGLEDLASDFTVGDYDTGDAVANNTAFTGTIDEVKVYGGLLAASEILVDMNAGSAAALGGVLGTQNNEGFGGDPPVGWWKMDENAGTSTTLDSSGNNLNGTMTNFTSADWKSGKFGSSLDFNGSTKRVVVTDTALLDITGGITIEAWVYPYEYRDWDRIVAKPVADAPPYNEYLITLNNDAQAKADVTVAVGGTSYGAETTSIVPLNQWTHLTGTYDGETVQIYFNGVLQGTNTSPSGNIDTNNQDLYFGYNPFQASQYFNGLLDNIKIYNYARTPAQIAYDYNRGAPIAHYKFDECQGTTAYNAAVAGSGAAAGMDGTITLGAAPAIGDCTTAGTARGDGATGKRNASIDLDGTDDYVTIADNANLDFGDTDDLTLSGWFNRDTFTTDDVIVAKRNGIANTDQGYILYIDDATDKLTFEICDATVTCDEYQLESTSTFTSTGWNHFVVVWDQDSAANSEIYINGQADNATDTGTIGNVGDLSNANALRLGSESDGANYFDGKLDELKIYRFAMPASQIKTLYNDTAVRFGPASGSP